MNPKKVQNNAKLCIGGAVVWKDKFLILFKPKKKWWEFPGGKLEEGETPSQAAQREVFEETGLKLQVDKLEGLFSFNNNKTSMIYLKFLMIVLQEEEPKVVLSKEHSDYKWVSASTLLKSYRDIVSPMLLKYLTRPTSSNVYDITIT